jgi:hypothetical protein
MKTCIILTEKWLTSILTNTLKRLNSKLIE